MKATLSRPITLMVTGPVKPIRNDRRLCALPLLWLVLLALLCIGCRIPLPDSMRDGFDRTKEERLDHRIKEDPELSSLATLCSSIGELQNFKLLWRSASSHGKELHYYYASDIKPIDAAREIARNLDQNGWHTESNLSQHYSLFAFIKGQQMITVQYGGMGEADYGISCTKVDENISKR